MFKLILAFLIKLGFFLSIVFYTSHANDEITIGEEYYTDLYQFNQNGFLNLGRGINMGNYLEAEKWEGHWTGGRHIKKEYFSIIKAAGFQTVRIPVRFSIYSDKKPPYKLFPSIETRVKEVVDWALENDLKVVINVHHYEEIMQNPSQHKQRLISIWKQISHLFPEKNYSHEKLFFEILNEPHNKLDYQLWNEYLSYIVRIVRGDPLQKNRVLIISPAFWGNVRYLPLLELPAKCNAMNTIVTFHYYDPMPLTHQGADWLAPFLKAEKWTGHVWTGTPSQKKAVTRALDRAVKWSEKNGNIPLWMGEFGVYQKYTDLKYCSAWTAYVAREAEKRDIAWAFWEFSESFGAYDLKKKQWKPEIINALVPER